MLCQKTVKNFNETVRKNYRPLFVYLRKNNGRGRAEGMLVAVKKENDEVVIGWSKCTFRRKGEKCDKFNREEGFYIAASRAVSRDNEKNPKKKVKKNEKKNVLKIANEEEVSFHLAGQVPHLVSKALQRFVGRVKRYYKTEKVSFYL